MIGYQELVEKLEGVATRYLDRANAAEARAAELQACVAELESAPAIDLEQFRVSVEAEYDAAMAACEGFAFAARERHEATEKRDRLIAVIDGNVRTSSEHMEEATNIVGQRGEMCGGCGACGDGCATRPSGCRVLEDSPGGGRIGPDRRQQGRGGAPVSAINEVLERLPRQLSGLPMTVREDVKALMVEAYSLQVRVAELEARPAIGLSNTLGYTPGYLDKTSPVAIWLQIDTGGDNDERSEQWPGYEHVTWHDEPIGGLEVQYVRADLALIDGSNVGGLAEQTGNPVQLPVALQRVIQKSRRFCETTEDEGTFDIGREWADALTTIGLLERVQRSPALWESTEAMHELIFVDKALVANEGRGGAAVIPRKLVRNWRWWAALPVQLPIVCLHVTMKGIDWVLERVHHFVWGWVNGGRND